MSYIIQPIKHQEEEEQEQQQKNVLCLLINSLLLGENNKRPPPDYFIDFLSLEKKSEEDYFCYPPDPNPRYRPHCTRSSSKVELVFYGYHEELSPFLENMLRETNSSLFHVSSINHLEHVSETKDRETRATIFSLTEKRYGLQTALDLEKKRGCFSVMKIIVSGEILSSP